MRISTKKLVSDFVERSSKRNMNQSIFTCIPLNALSDNLRIALCEKSSFFIGKFDVAKVYLWSSIVHVVFFPDDDEESAFGFCSGSSEKEGKKKNYKH